MHRHVLRKIKVRLRPWPCREGYAPSLLNDKEWLYADEYHVNAEIDFEESKGSSANEGAWMHGNLHFYVDI